MKKITFIFSLLFFFQMSLAQLYVKNNTYVFNKGAMVYVKGNIELNGANSTLYLRNEGQLLQGTSSTSTNKGIGKLSVFQEGSVNNYAYNYWCSPIGNASAAVGNENFGISMLNVPTTSTASTAATILPTNNYNGSCSTGTLSIAPYWIWRFLSSLTYSDWFYTGSSTNITPGQGFTMKGTSGTDTTNPGETTTNNPGSKQRYDFRGKPNDGDITINVANGKYTLTGNPYPSAIDLSAFLTNATNCTGVAYFWEQDKTVNSHLIANYRGGYSTFSPVSRGGTGIYVPATFYAFDSAGNQLGVVSTPNNSYARYFSPIGQGFMIEGNASGSTVTMKNSYRVYQKENAATSVFEKNGYNVLQSVNNHLPEILSVSGFDYTTVSTQEVPQIKFNSLLNNQAIKQMVLAFDDNATDGVDHAMDAKSPDDGTPIDMYFLLNNEGYVINITTFDENKKIPIGFKSDETASIKLTVADIINFNQAENVYLHDKQTDLYHDIKNAIYEFSVDSGTTNNRYEITFKNEALRTPTNQVNYFTIVQNNATQTLSIENKLNTDIQSVTLHDILGKEILSNSPVGQQNQYEYSTNTLSEGIYIVKIITSLNEYTNQKIIIKKQP
ncbi:T9SS type A sorting domain-containing protein [Flavobacterium aciduliphilum]|uniref:Putative secreted protein (Por secretion system target) n=1 Tax=Flavobacterium aciduliphilum TaxID=1101402 RepID=A0A328YJW8_9FLAO|nr:T9SS type A sorting domain-containing protein [Flavobacterium aciduliphilum]RAR74219.1 putative secreted protein (Por secretion system target) [Flavobacterium aciduliphilum]